MKAAGARFWVAVALMGLAAFFLHAREMREVIPAHEPLDKFPLQLAAWSGEDLPIPDETRKVLRTDDLLLRQYVRLDAEEPPVDLFIAYFPTQRTGVTYHSPRNCLPDSGWAEIQPREPVPLSGSGFQPFVANQYVVAKGPDRLLVVYWYLAHGEAIASEYAAKIRLVKDSFRLNRSDGSLIRITTPLQPQETVNDAMARLQPFAEAVIPKFGAFIPD